MTDSVEANEGTDVKLSPLVPKIIHSEAIEHADFLSVSSSFLSIISFSMASLHGGTEESRSLHSISRQRLPFPKRVIGVFGMGVPKTSLFSEYGSSSSGWAMSLPPHRTVELPGHPERSTGDTQICPPTAMVSVEEVAVLMPFTTWRAVAAHCPGLNYGSWHLVNSSSLIFFFDAIFDRICPPRTYGPC